MWSIPCFWGWGALITERIREKNLSLPGISFSLLSLALWDCSKGHCYLNGYLSLLLILISDFVKFLLHNPVKRTFFCSSPKTSSLAPELTMGHKNYFSSSINKLILFFDEKNNQDFLPTS
jgi:hypothetical protein